MFKFVVITLMLMVGTCRANFDDGLFPQDDDDSIVIDTLFQNDIIVINDIDSLDAALLRINEWNPPELENVGVWAVYQRQQAQARNDAGDWNAAMTRALTAINNWVFGVRDGRCGKKRSLLAAASGEMMLDNAAGQRALKRSTPAHYTRCDDLHDSCSGNQLTLRPCRACVKACIDSAYEEARLGCNSGWLDESWARVKGCRARYDKYAPRCLPFNCRSI